MSEEFKNLEEEKIRLLKWPEAIRQRYGMYLDAGSACVNNCLREIIDNSLDEVQYGADKIMIHRNLGGYSMVWDSGRGIPISFSDEVDEEGRPITQAKLSISSLHSGSKFSDASKVNITIGMNGVGSSAVCAISDDYILMSRITPTNYDRSIPEVRAVWEENPVRKKDLFYIVWYKRGILYYEGAGKLNDLEKMVFGKKVKVDIPSGGSTIVLFRLDSSIFTKEELGSMEINIQNLQYFLLIQERFYGKKKVSIDVEGNILTGSGFKGFGCDLIKEITPADPSANPKLGLFISIGYDEDLGPKEEYGSVNSLTVDSGVHINYVENAFAKALKENYGIKHRYLTTGLKLCVVALGSEVVFSSQTKEKLKSFTKVKEADFAPLVKEFSKMFKKYDEYWDAYVEKLNYLADSMKSLSAMDKAQKIMDDAAGRGIYKAKGEMIEGFSDATAPANDRWNCEAFIVEGLSPGGSLKAARKSTKYSAVIPLRGKVKNVKDSNADQMMDNKELFTIFKLIGLGIDVNNVTKGCTTAEEAFAKIKQYSRYGKIVIATD